MTKQEEIREWYKDVLSGYGCPDTYLENETDKLLRYLHSQGVVIKVKNIQPINTYEDLTQSISDEGKYDIVVVEPLIKEVKSENS